jgi:hypothetical protein
MTYRKKLIQRKHRVAARKAEEKRKGIKPVAPAAGRPAVSLPRPV